MLSGEATLLHERHLDDVLGHEPDLQFVATDYVAD
jgi:hypothetical protein